MNTNYTKVTLFMIPLMLAACAVQHGGGFKPLSPSVVLTQPQSASKAESLQPALSWEGPAPSSDFYDLIVYTGIQKAVGFSWFYVPGREVYYREGISGTSHRLEQALQPDTVYVWGVRNRGGTNPGPWSTYSFQAGYIPVKGLAEKEGKNLWWRFKTPKK